MKNDGNASAAESNALVFPSFFMGFAAA